MDAQNFIFVGAGNFALFEAPAHLIEGGGGFRQFIIAQHRQKLAALAVGDSTAGIAQRR